MGWNPALLEQVTKILDHSSISRPTHMYLFNSLLKPNGKYFTLQTLNFPHKVY